MPAANHKCLLVVLSCIVLLASCVKPFNPPVLSSGNLNYLVVDGFIVPGSATTIKLSRTLNVSDSFRYVPESNAQLFIEGQSGTSYPFQSGINGEYTAPAPFLSPDDKYRLHIFLQDGKEYASDFVEVKESPPIDSITWDETDHIAIYANTHDPAGKARYYKWEFDETSEYHAVFDSFLDFQNGQIVFLEPDQYRFACFKYAKSNNIAIGTSSALSDDVIRRGLVTRFPNDGEKISFKYSINVKQYALTPEAFKYWQILQANTEQNGNLFDPQPAQLRSNIHAVNNPDEPVIGFVSVSNFREKRIFIRFTQLKRRTLPPFYDQCQGKSINPEQAADYLTNSGMLPAYFTTAGGLVIAPAMCVDCRLQGGSTEKPSYW